MTPLKDPHRVLTRAQHDHVTTAEAPAVDRGELLCDPVAVVDADDTKEPG